MNSGVYILKNEINRKIYIGSAINLKRRKLGHFHSSLHNDYLKKAMNKYGKNNFSWDILEKCENIIEREQYYLDKLLFAQEFINGDNNKFKELGYNLSPTAGNILGYKHSKSAVDKIIKFHTGRKRSEETKNKMSLAKIGIKKPKEFILKISKPVLQYTMDGYFIKEWESATQAYRNTNISNSLISNVCKGIRKSAGGSIWKWKNI